MVPEGTHRGRPFVQDFQCCQQQLNVLRGWCGPVQLDRPSPTIPANIDGIYGRSCGHGAVGSSHPPFIRLARGWPTAWTVSGTLPARVWWDYIGSRDVYLLHTA